MKPLKHGGKAREALSSKCKSGKKAPQGIFDHWKGEKL
jgi:hypothetical protein